jgi:hypothetical protein
VTQKKGRDPVEPQPYVGRIRARAVGAGVKRMRSVETPAPRERPRRQTKGSSTPPTTSPMVQVGRRSFVKGAQTLGKNHVKGVGTVGERERHGGFEVVPGLRATVTTGSLRRHPGPRSARCSSLACQPANLWEGRRLSLGARGSAPQLSAESTESAHSPSR